MALNLEDFFYISIAFYFLFLNFNVLFEYLDIQNRVYFVSKKNQMWIMERVMGVRSQNEYRCGIGNSAQIDHLIPL